MQLYVIEANKPDFGKGKNMQKYTATLTRDVVTKITMYDYTVDCPMKAGKRGFKTIKRMKQWIDAINAEHGLNTAVMG